MQKGYTLNVFYVICVVIVLLAYPVKNYSAFAKSTSGKSVPKVEKVVAEESSELLHSDLLFK